jgi:hypothetical protein
VIQSINTHYIIIYFLAFPVAALDDIDLRPPVVGPDVDPGADNWSIAFDVVSFA